MILQPAFFPKKTTPDSLSVKIVLGTPVLEDITMRASAKLVASLVFMSVKEQNFVVTQTDTRMLTVMWLAFLVAF